jgi:tetratricopeptide (TPR) repeat protein
MDEPDLQTLLREGITAAKAAQQESASQTGAPPKRIQRIGAAKTNQRERARQLLLRVTELDERNILAWLWLSTVMDTVEEQQICLENVLTLDPNNKAARTGLTRLDQMARAPQPPKPSPPPPAPPSPRVTPSHPPTPTSQPPKTESVASQSKPAQKKTAGNPCPFCQLFIPTMATSCPHCHLPLAVTCPACGADVDVEHKACAQCGHDIGNYRRKVAYFAGLAAAYQEEGRSAEAVKAWQAVETLRPDYPELYFHLGQAQLGLGRDDRAMTSFQRALEQNPDSVQAHFALGELLRQRDEIEDAYRHFLRITELDPRHGLAWLRLGQLYEKARRRQEATQAYKRAAALLKTGSTESHLAQQQLAQLQPGLPVAMATGWTELLRQMTGPIFICLLMALLDAGLRPWWIPWSGWLALILAPLGTFLFVSGTSLPRNPLICLLVGEEGLPSDGLRIPVAVIGMGCWLLALGLILLPLGSQSFPEIPPLPS